MSITYTPIKEGIWYSFGVRSIDKYHSAIPADSLGRLIILGDLIKTSTGLWRVRYTGRESQLFDNKTDAKLFIEAVYSLDY